MTRNKTRTRAAHAARSVQQVQGPRLAELDTLVTDWVSLAEICRRFGLSPSQVRKQIQERELVAVTLGDGRGQCVPAAFLTDSGPRPELRGTVTVLADGGMDDVELLVWLFTQDASLPGAGTPMEAIIAGHKTEVRRRAMEAAF